MQDGVALSIQELDGVVRHGAYLVSANDVVPDVRKEDSTGH